MSNLKTIKAVAKARKAAKAVPPPVMGPETTGGAFRRERKTANVISCGITDEVLGQITTYCNAHEQRLSDFVRAAIRLFLASRPEKQSKVHEFTEET